MKIKINNKETETEAKSVYELSESLGVPEKGVAIAVNNAIVARKDWGSLTIKEGDDIIILKAFAGG